MSESGLKPYAEKKYAITEMRSSKNKEELQRFWGMVHYFFQFIPDQSEITSPLRQEKKERKKQRGPGRMSTHSKWNFLKKSCLASLF